MSHTRRAFQKRIEQYQLRLQAQPGLMGDPLGNVSVPDRAGYVYVRVNDITEIAYNDRVTPVYDLPILVGYDPLQPRLYRVLDALMVYEEAPYNAGVPSHHETHEYMGLTTSGHDLVFVHLRAWLPLRVAPAGGLTITVYRGIALVGSTWTAVEQAAALDLTAYQPVSGARYVLIQALSDGTIDIVAGAVKTLLTIALSDIPAPYTQALPLAGILLYAGQTAIQENRITNDLVDLRWPGRPQSTTGGGSNLIPLSTRGASGPEIVFDRAGNVIMTREA